jgi:hypothetical protein
MKKRLAILLLALALAPNYAAAGPINPREIDPDDMAWFYNRPGASPEQVFSDASECEQFGRRLFGAPTTDRSAAMTGVVPQIMLAIVVSGPVVAYTDDCMMSKGYRRFNVAGGTLRAFNDRVAAMSLEAQAQLAGAETPPEGVLARQWVNTYWIPANGEEQAASARERTHRSVAPQFMGREAKLFIDALEDGAAISPGPSDAVFVMTFRAAGPGKVYLARDQFATGDPDVVALGRRERWPTLLAEAGDRRPDASGVVQLVFVAPAGAYALSAVGQGYYIRSTFFCYETIAFTARPGEVVHLGAYTVETEPPSVHALAPAPRQRLRIDPLELEAARADLSQRPDLAARMTLAQYVNNFPHSCPEVVGIAAYGLDMPDAPLWRAEAQTPSSPEAGY